MHLALYPTFNSAFNPEAHRTSVTEVFAHRMTRADHGPRLALSQPFGHLSAQTVYDKATGLSVAEIRDDANVPGSFRVYYTASACGWANSVTLDARRLDVLFDYVELGVSVDDAVWTLVHH